MEKNQLREIVLEQQATLNTLEQGVKRECLQRLIDVMPLPHVIAVTGMRRCGKSTLLLQAIYQHFGQEVYYLDFEDERLIEFTVEDFNLLHEVFLELFDERKVFFFDEIQVVDQWETYVRRMYKAGYKFIISGSSADLLSSELSTKLTGRHIALELHPFSFREFLTLHNAMPNMEAGRPLLTKERGLLKQRFNDCIKRGGIPEYLHYQNELILRGIYENILYKDVVVRFDIKAVKALRELALWVMSNPSCLLSYTKLKSTLNLGSINTVKNYVHYLESAYLIFTLPCYSYSVGKQANLPKKVYAIDSGLINAIGFHFSRKGGQLLENIIYLELRRRFLPNHSLYYYQTQSGFEVDFCLRDGAHITMMVQVSEQFDEPSTRAREVRAILEALKETKLHQGIIITQDHQETIELEGCQIKCVPAAFWLLDYNACPNITEPAGLLD